MDFSCFFRLVCEESFRFLVSSGRQDAHRCRVDLTVFFSIDGLNDQVFDESLTLSGVCGSILKAKIGFVWACLFVSKHPSGREWLPSPDRVVVFCGERVSGAQQDKSDVALHSFLAPTVTSIGQRRREKRSKQGKTILANCFELMTKKLMELRSQTGQRGNFSSLSGQTLRVCVYN